MAEKRTCRHCGEDFGDQLSLLIAHEQHCRERQAEQTTAEDTYSSEKGHGPALRYGGNGKALIWAGLGIVTGFLIYFTSLADDQSDDSSIFIEEPLENQYTVVEGDTLSAIAKAHNLSLDKLLEHNPDITKLSIINIGQIIRIPLDIAYGSNTSENLGMSALDNIQPAPTTLDQISDIAPFTFSKISDFRVSDFNGNGISDVFVTGFENISGQNLPDVHFGLLTFDNRAWKYEEAGKPGPCDSASAGDIIFERDIGNDSRHEIVVKHSSDGLIDYYVFGFVDTKFKLITTLSGEVATSSTDYGEYSGSTIVGGDYVGNSTAEIKLTTREYDTDSAKDVELIYTLDGNILKILQKRTVNSLVKKIKKQSKPTPREDDQLSLYYAAHSPSNSDFSFDYSRRIRLYGDYSGGWESCRNPASHGVDLDTYYDEYEYDSNYKLRRVNPKKEHRKARYYLLNDTELNIIFVRFGPWSSRSQSAPIRTFMSVTVDGDRQIRDLDYLFFIEH